MCLQLFISDVFSQNKKKKKILQWSQLVQGGIHKNMAACEIMTVCEKLYINTRVYPKVAWFVHRCEQLK